MLIVDIPMPMNCGECPFVTPYSRCVFLGNYAIDENRRAENCPIKGELVTCGECRYPLKKETPVGTVKYDCVLHNGWYDADHYCGHGERHGERNDLHELARTYTRASGKDGEHEE